MTQEKVDAFIMAKGKYFPTESIYAVRDKLLALDDNKEIMIHSMEFKEPTTLLIVSLLAGSFGIDRFLLGDTGLGVLKLLTGGVCGIMTIIDWFTVTKRAKEENLKKLMMF